MRRSNPHLDRLAEVQLVQDFLLRHDMQGKLCNRGGTNSYVIYRLPYVIEFIDYYIENYLAIYFSDINSSCLLTEGDLIYCSVALEIQNREILKNASFVDHPQTSLFISEGDQKMYGLQTTVAAIDQLLPLIEAKGGLAAMRDGTFDPRFDFSTSVSPMWFGLKDEYLQCIGKAD